jgi:hypothetical protein
LFHGPFQQIAAVLIGSSNGESDIVGEQTTRSIRTPAIVALLAAEHHSRLRWARRRDNG